MADAFDQADAGAIGRWSSAFAKAAKAAPSLLYALRLWAAVCLALFVAFWLELDNPFWAGTSAAIVCRCSLGLLRKRLVSMIGTVVGATLIVVLTASFRRIALPSGASCLWGGPALAATVFALSPTGLARSLYRSDQYADNLGATGGASSMSSCSRSPPRRDLHRIACAGIVPGIDPGGAKRRLSRIICDLAAEIMGRLAGCSPAEAQLPETKAERRGSSGASCA
jgi:hypothetical protein